MGQSTYPNVIEYLQDCVEHVSQQFGYYEAGPSPAEEFIDPSFGGLLLI